MDPSELQELIKNGENVYVQSTITLWFQMLISSAIERLTIKVRTVTHTYDFSA